MRRPNTTRSPVAVLGAAIAVTVGLALAGCGSSGGTAATAFGFEV